jgi:hypothetical protein
VRGPRTEPYEQGANLTSSRRLQVKCSARIPEYTKILKNEVKFQKSFWTQKVYQDILKTQRLIKQEKNETKENGHRKIQKPQKKWDFPQWSRQFCFRINP